ncbi:MAG: NAD(P)-dependent oxidoreductase [Fusobacterium gastrosuis]|uniref:SDR family oxidoreductase n=1 Tax=Fusobacterium gastrosuis TaxID=1755100 RepID=UPI00297B2269|nr:NAD(P)-dependent oxidoreductase [Fusobacteriaceae bacterium]MDY4010122.1 NAD(P)-dependent oxidoreductase [Fusobacterium gastrosuis]MDY5713964.1 NAD(P)-dependent oxidoreductase [Fusobacterium gastrosuis]
MKIAVLAANGKAGSLIVKEAVERGFDVTAVVRGENKTVAKNVIIKDLLDLTKEDLQGFDAVVSAFGAWTVETLPLYTTTSIHLLDILKGTNTRILIIGGAGSLYLDESLTTQLIDTPEFPEEYKPVASAAQKALAEIRKNENKNWTYISPAADFDYEAERKGRYLLAGEVFTTNEKGESKISYADYAIAMVDEIEKGNNIGKRISVLWK